MICDALTARTHPIRILQTRTISPVSSFRSLLKSDKCALRAIPSHAQLAPRLPEARRDVKDAQLAARSTAPGE
jgi:hypothetical protein